MTVKKAKFSRYDVTEYLKSKEEFAAYLGACIGRNGRPASQQYHRGSAWDDASMPSSAQLSKDSGILLEGLCKAMLQTGTEPPQC